MILLEFFLSNSYKEPLRVLEKYPSLGKPKTLNKDLDPFKSENWVSVRELVLNNEPSEEKYITPSLAKYPTMHKRAGAKEVKRPYEMHVKLHDLSSVNKINALLDLIRNFS
ncbi:unnamed protein product [Rhizophagus irregularis]|nr:unnamed protein product [Rhizophagus irregularis]